MSTQVTPEDRQSGQLRPDSTVAAHHPRRTIGRRAPRLSSRLVAFRHVGFVGDVGIAVELEICVRRIIFPELVNRGDRVVPLGSSGSSADVYPRPTTVGSGLSSPYDVAMDGAGDVFIAASGNTRVVEVNRSHPPL
jgi:hypothetical protein